MALNSMYPERYDMWTRAEVPPSDTASARDMIIATAAALLVSEDTKSEPAVVTVHPADTGEIRRTTDGAHVTAKRFLTFGQITVQGTQRGYEV